MEQYLVRFVDLHREGHSFTFPCDKNGHVDFDALSPKCQQHYLAALRRISGDDLAVPKIEFVG